MKKAVVLAAALFLSGCISEIRHAWMFGMSTEYCTNQNSITISNVRLTPQPFGPGRFNWHLECNEGSFECSGVPVDHGHEPFGQTVMEGRCRQVQEGTDARTE